MFCSPSLIFNRQQDVVRIWFQIEMAVHGEPSIGFMDGSR